MKLLAARYLAYAQACFYAGMLVCIVIRPAGLTANGGISYYGIYRETIIPYGFALLGAAYFSIRAAEHIHKPDLKLMKYALSISGLMIIGIAFTPDSLGMIWDNFHRAFGITLFVLQLLLSVWLVVKLRYSQVAIGLLTAELLGGIASFLYLAPPHGLLLESQVLFQAAFGGLAVYALNRLITD